MGLHRHTRFLIAFGLGLALWGVSFLTPLDAVFRAVLAVNGFFVAYLGLMLQLTLISTADTLRKYAEDDDEGSALILVLALGALTVSLAAVFLVLNRESGTMTGSVFALAAAPLGWATLHVMAGYRYAHLYYAAQSDGLNFPGKAKPGAWDFLYFSFTIGMTAQISDIEVTTTPMRKVVLLHSVGSFFFNTVILALAVNAALTMGK